MYYILYDIQDNICCYFDSVGEFLSYSLIPLKEFNRKFNKSMNNYILCDIDNVRYKLYRFNEVDHD